MLQFLILNKFSRLFNNKHKFFNNYNSKLMVIYNSNNKNNKNKFLKAIHEKYNL